MAVRFSLSRQKSKMHQDAMFYRDLCSTLESFEQLSCHIFMIFLDMSDPYDLIEIKLSNYLPYLPRISSLP